MWWTQTLGELTTQLGEAEETSNTKVQELSWNKIHIIIFGLNTAEFTVDRDYILLLSVKILFNLIKTALI